MAVPLANGHHYVKIPTLERYAGFEDVYIDEANQLTIGDLFTLHPTCGNGWIVSSVIDSYLNILTKSCPGNICFIKSEAATLIANAVSLKSKPFEALNLNFVKKMAFPINILRSHWALVVVDHQSKKVMKYDPAGNESNLSVENGIIKWYGDHKFSRFEKKILREAVDDGTDEFIDRSGCDGGIWILYEVWKIARDDIASHERPSPEELRIRLFIELVNGSILEETKLSLDLLAQAIRKLDRIVKSHALFSMNYHGIQGNESSADQETRGCQTDDLIFKCHLGDLMRYSHFDTSHSNEASHFETERCEGVYLPQSLPPTQNRRSGVARASPPLNGNHDNDSSGKESMDEDI